MVTAKVTNSVTNSWVAFCIRQKLIFKKSYQKKETNERRKLHNLEICVRWVVLPIHQVNFQIQAIYLVNCNTSLMLLKSYRPGDYVSRVTIWVRFLNPGRCPEWGSQDAWADLNQGPSNQCNESVHSWCGSLLLCNKEHTKRGPVAFKTGGEIQRQKESISLHHSEQATQWV